MAVIIFKAIEKCNSNCIYCDVIRKHQNEIMPYDLLELVFKRINEYLEETPEDDVHLTWHGGEACLLGADYFRKALEFQNRHCAGTKDRIIHLIQSNMTVMTQELVNVFKELGIDRIGSSFEVLPNIRGIGKNRDSKKYNEQFFRGVNLAEKNGLSWGFIYVVHRLSLPHAERILYTLNNLNPKTPPAFNMIYCFVDDEHRIGITATEYADFLGKILPIYWADQERFGEVKPIATLINAIRGKGGLVCDYSGQCGNRWMYIGPKGDTSHCGKGGDFGFIDYGSIRDVTLRQVLYHPKREPILSRQATLPRGECRDCRFWGICHGGCPMDAYAAYHDFSRKTGVCEWIKRFVEVYLEPVTGLRVDLPPPSESRS
jgi:uncharacterized protein